jgi:FHA domain
VKPTAVLLAIALWAAPALAASATGAQWATLRHAAGSAVEPVGPTFVAEHGSSQLGPNQIGPSQLATAAGDATVSEPRPEGLVDRLMATIGRLNAMLKAGSAKLPALVLVLSAMLILPVAALASWAVQRTAHVRGLHIARPKKSSNVAPAEDAHGVTDTQAWPARAWLAIEGDAMGAHQIDCEMLRIGRHPDNEVWLTEDSVHRYHAVIHRTEDAEFVITDLSGDAGNGVQVNGARLSKARLANGDVIQLGRAKLTFASTPM